MVPQAADLVSISAVLLFEGVRFCVSFAAASDTLLAKTTTAMKQFRFDLVLAPPSHTTLESNGPFWKCRREGFYKLGASLYKAFI